MNLSASVFKRTVQILFFTGMFGILLYLTVIFKGDAHIGRVAGLKACMVAIKKDADKYAIDHEGHYATSCKILFVDAKKLPDNPWKKKGYLFDLSPLLVDELLKQNNEALKTIIRPGCIAYGLDSEQKDYAIVGFDNEWSQLPIGGFNNTLVLTKSGVRPNLYSKK